MSLAKSSSSFRRDRPAAWLVLLALVLVGATGFTSCTTDSGAWTGPALELIPGEILLRGSKGSPPAVGLARLEGGDPDDRYDPSLEYPSGGVTGWLRLAMSGRNLTVTAAADDLNPGLYTATVFVTGESSGGRTSLRVEFNVQ